MVVLSVLINKDAILPAKHAGGFFMGVTVLRRVRREFRRAVTFPAPPASGMALIFAAVVAIAFHRTLVRRAGRHFTAFETVYLTTGMGALGFSASRRR